MLLTIAHLLLTGLSVLLVSKVVPGIRVRSYGAAVVFAVVVAVLNAIAWHLLAPVSYTFAVLTLGLGALVINALVFMIADKLIDGIEISGFFPALLGSVGVSVVNWAMHFALGRWAP